MEKVDARLIAIARGEIDPEEGLEPLPRAVPPRRSEPRLIAARGFEPRRDSSTAVVGEDDLIEVDEDWLESDVEPEPFPDG
ncbi:MAG: hypothetical protein KF795_22485 [Labilithrix sp.]|nr:hypothetical protein [Labilithrix sp.]